MLPIQSSNLVKYDCALFFFEEILQTFLYVTFFFRFKYIFFYVLPNTLLSRPMFLGKWKTVSTLILQQVSGTFSHLNDLFKIIILRTYSNSLLPYDILAIMLYQRISFTVCLVESTRTQQQLSVPTQSSLHAIARHDTHSYVFGLEPVL